MPIIACILFLVFSGFLTPVTADATAPEWRAMTYNIRYANPGDGENRWENRRDTVAEAIAARADVAGLQEVLPTQARDLQIRLPGFAWVLRGREARAGTGEACPVLWRSSVFDLMESGTFWLSESPDVAGSKSWDSSLPRICTWVKLRDKVNGGSLHVFNVHLDHRSAEARRNGAALVAARAAAIAGPVLVLGDFNEVWGGPATTAIAGGAGWSEASRTLAESARGSFNNWQKQHVLPQIDFLMVRGLAITRAEVPRPATARGGWASDHFPVVAKLRLAPAAVAPAP